jgi:hypothetical protein
MQRSRTQFSQTKVTPSCRRRLFAVSRADIHGDFRKSPVFRILPCTLPSSFRRISPSAAARGAADQVMLITAREVMPACDVDHCAGSGLTAILQQ